MRVIAGSARGTRLQCPKGRSVRPTSDRVRESLFNILADSAVEAAVVDLFAGAGTLGIEALSRGGRLCAFVEKDRNCARLLEANLAHTRLSHLAEVVRGDVFRCLSRLEKAEQQFDLVLCDPPYTLTNSREGHDRLLTLFDRLAADNLVRTDALLVIEHDARTVFADATAHWRLADRRGYGHTALSFFELIPPSD